MKECTKCKKVLSLNNFHKDKNKPSGVHSQCKACKNSIQFLRKSNINNEVIISEKVCSSCKEEKKVQQFDKEKANIDGLKYTCKDCNYFSSILRKYNLSKNEYLDILNKQDNKCAICSSNNTNNRLIKRFHVDHNHHTGKVRGLLCDSCNRALGLFKDSKENLIKALEYISENT